MDKYLFSYASAADPPVKRGLIRMVEVATGQPRLKRMYLDNQRNPRAGESFFAAAVRKLELEVQFDPAALAAIPAAGPVVIVANHPYGVLDGIVISWLVEQVRRDFVVLTNAVLMRAPEVQDFILPIDFSEAPEALETNIKTRAAARAQLERGGVVVVFAAGGVSTAPDRWGRRPAIDARWQPFVAQLIQRGRATVVPIWFGGQNSRLFQIASHVSASLRLSLLFREVKARIGAALPVVVGTPIAFAEIAHLRDRQALADHLRAATYALAAPQPRKPRPLEPLRQALKLRRSAA
jgi:putative hemolysin